MSCNHSEYKPNPGKTYGAPQREHVVPAVFINGMLQKIPAGYVIPECYIPGEANSIQQINLVNENTTQVALQIVTTNGTYTVPLQSLEETPDIPVAGTAPPLPDNATGASLGVSNSWAREDHQHPIVKRSIMALPPVLAFGDLVITSETVLVTAATEESLHYSLQINFTLSNTNPSGFVLPTLPGYIMSEAQFSNVYDPAAVGTNPFFGQHPSFLLGHGIFGIRRRAGATAATQFIVYANLSYVTI